MAKEYTGEVVSSPAKEYTGEVIPNITDYVPSAEEQVRRARAAAPAVAQPSPAFPSAPSGAALPRPTSPGTKPTYKLPGRTGYDFPAIGTSALGAGLFGAALPGALEYGGRIAETTPFPGVQALGKGMRATAPLIGGNIFTRGLSGLFSGGLSEAAGQTVEIAPGGEGLPAEATRFVIGGLPVSTASSFITGKFGSMMRALGRSGERFDPTAAYRKAISDREEALVALRGPGIDPAGYQSIYDKIKQGVEYDALLYNVRAAEIATTAEDFAIKIAQEQAAAKGGVPSATAKKLSDDFLSAISQLNSEAESNAQKLIYQGKETAKRIRDSAANKAQQERSFLTSKADEIEKKAEADANDLIRTTNAEITRLRGLSKRETGFIREAEQQYQQSLKRLGAAPTETDFGVLVRAAPESQFQFFRQIRKDQIKPAETAIFEAARNKEIAGQAYQNTAAYAKAQKDINAFLIDPETQRATATIPQHKAQIQSVIDALRGTKRISVGPDGKKIEENIPGNFQSLEYLRRFLQDRASGLPAEGFDAISQKQAGKLRDIVSGVQEDFVPGWKQYLDNYAESSKRLNQYKSQLGQKLVGKEDFDFSQFSTDAAKLGDAVFSSAGAVQQYERLSGLSREQVAELGRGYIANQVLNKGVEPSSLLKTNNDWLSLPGMQTLKSDLQNMAAQKTRAGRVSEVRGKTREQAIKEAAALREGLRTAEPIETILEKGKKERQEVLTKGRAEIAKKTTKAAGAAEQSQMDALNKAVTEVKESSSIPKEKANALVSEFEKLKVTPARAFEELVFGADPEKKLTLFGEYITKTQQGQEDFINAIQKGLADRVKADPAALQREWNDKIAPALLKANMLSQRDINTITQRLNAVEKVSRGSAEQLSVGKRIIVNGLRTAFGVVPARIVDKMTEE